MGNDRAGAIVHRYKVTQNRIDKAIDGKFDKEPWGERVPNPRILLNGARQWTFG